MKFSWIRIEKAFLSGSPSERMKKAALLIDWEDSLCSGSSLIQTIPADAFLFPAGADQKVPPAFVWCVVMIPFVGIVQAINRLQRSVGSAPANAFVVPADRSQVVAFMNLRGIKRSPELGLYRRYFAFCTVGIASIWSGRRICSVGAGSSVEYLRMVPSSNRTSRTAKAGLSMGMISLVS